MHVALKSRGLAPALIVTVVVAAAAIILPAKSVFGSPACSGTGYGATAPEVNSVTPYSGPTAGGTTVVISGCGFSNSTTSVKFGTTAAASFTVNSDTQITAVTPAHAAGRVDVTVTTASGTSATNVNDSFTFGGCDSANMSPDKASPQAAGTTITFTASSTGCPNPEYQFWRLINGTWTVVQAYGGATFVWTTTGLTSGVYQVGVRVRQIGEAFGYEAYWLGTYTLSVQTCTAADLSTPTTSPQPAGTMITWTATSTRCVSPTYRFWVSQHGGPFVMKRDFGANTWTWDTTGLAADTYQVGVWALEAGSTNTYDAYGITTFVIAAGGTCNSAGATALPAPPQAPGATVVVTGSSNGCVAPQFEFWLLPPGGSWTIKQAYSVAAVFNWNTTGYALGTYQIGVWVKATASSSSYDAYFIRTYQLDVGMCTAAGISGSPASPQSPGTAVTYTATSVGCGTPQYEFWQEQPAGSGNWVIVQPYSATATFPWNTTGKAKGPYRFGVWARQTGSPNSYDSFAILTYWLN